MKIKFHGAAQEVGRSAIRINEKNKNILLDYGIKIDGDKNVMPLPVKEYIDATIISHAHLDHSGATPLLYQKSEQPIYMTPPTIPLINLLVNDSIKINKIKGVKQTFSYQNIKRMGRNTIQTPYSKTKEIYDFRFKFEDAGHITGAASTELIMNDKKVVYTGDVKFEETKLHAPGFQKYKDVDVLIIEATYGDRKHEKRKKIEKDFVGACQEMCDSQGNVLVPAFALGRTQEIISILYENNFDYPIYMDGMSKAVAEIMMDHPDYVKDYRLFYSAMKEAEWVYSSKQRTQALSEPSVIVSTAGMLSGGPAISYLLKMKELRKKAVFFSGYQVEGTPGRILLEEKRLKYDEYDLNLSDYDIRHFDFSAHTDKEGLINLVKNISPKLVIIQHGEKEQCLALKKNLEAEGFTVVVPKFAEEINVEKYL